MEDLHGPRFRLEPDGMAIDALINIPNDVFAYIADSIVRQGSCLPVR